jgi:hypothetical protein
MAGFMVPLPARQYAGMLAELRRENTLDGHSVQSWSQGVVSAADHSEQIELRVTFAPLRLGHVAGAAFAPMGQVMTTLYRFPLADVRALEGDTREQTA